MYDLIAKLPMRERRENDEIMCWFDTYKEEAFEKIIFPYMKDKKFLRTLRNRNFFTMQYFVN